MTDIVLAQVILLYLSSLHLTNYFYLFLGSMFVITMLQPQNSNPHPNDDTRCMPHHQQPSTCLPASWAPACEVDCRWGWGRRWWWWLRHEHGQCQHQWTTPTPVGNTNTNANASVNGRRNANDSRRHQCQWMMPTPVPQPMTWDNTTPPLPSLIETPDGGGYFILFCTNKPSQRVHPASWASAHRVDFFFFFSFHYSL